MKNKDTKKESDLKELDEELISNDISLKDFFSNAKTVNSRKEMNPYKIYEDIMKESRNERN